MKLIICLLIIFIQSKLLLPIKYIISENNQLDIISIYESYNKGYLETQIEIGSNKVPIKFKLSFDSYSTIILNSSIIDIPIKYNINKSKTHQMFSFKFRFKNELIKEGYLASDIFNINNNNTKPRLNFFLYNKNRDKIYYEGIIGLGLNNIRDYSFPGYNFIYQLKQNSLINDYTIFFEQNNNDNNIDNLVIGEYPYENKTNIYEKDKRIDIIYTNYNNSKYNYYILIDCIIVNNNIISSLNFLNFDLSSFFIEGTEIYRNYIIDIYFNKYINDKKCNISKSDILGEFFYCDKDIDITKIPNLVFNIKSLDYNLTLTYEHLFKLISNKQFFMIIFKNNTIWKMGYLAIKELKIGFNQDTKQFHL